MGTSVAYLNDSTRRSSELADGRPISLQLWYPATARTGRTASYLFEPQLAATLESRGYYGVDSTTVAAWNVLPTHAVLDARITSGRHPLVTLSVGLGVIRANYTSIAEELASHGYVVALVESPQAGVLVRPNGGVVTDTTSRLDTAARHRQAVDDWARDVSFALDHLQSRRPPGNLHRIGRAIDWRHVGAIGHSSGGLVAVAVCQGDARVRACVDMDGGLVTPAAEPLASFVETGVSKPMLILRSQPLYSDADFARRGITRAQWEQRGDADRQAFSDFVTRSRAPVWRIRLAGTGHFSFSDAPFVMPSAVTRFGGTFVEPIRGLHIVGATLREFLERAPADPTWDGHDLATRYPELTITRETPPHSSSAPAQRR